MSVPFYRFYPTDYEADTSHLTMLEDGAYNRLLRLCWMTPGCSLPDDETWIMRRMRVRTDEEREAVLVVLDEFFERENQRVFSNRLCKEFEHANDRRDTAMKNGAKGGRPPKALKEKETAKPGGIAKQKPGETGSLTNQNQNQNQSNIGDFDNFWSQVPRKVGKGNARRAFKAALKKADAGTLIGGMKEYARSVQGREETFIAHPATWLNGERWEDEPAHSQQKSNDVELERWRRLAGGTR